MFKRRKSKLQIFLSSSTFITLVGFLVIVLILIPLVKNIKKQVTVNKELSNLEKEIADLEKKNTELNDLISYLNSDEFTEEQARLNLNYKKEGEEVLIIKDDESYTSSNNDSLNSIYNIKGLENESVSKKETNAKKWLQYFVN